MHSNLIFMQNLQSIYADTPAASLDFLMSELRHNMLWEVPENFCLIVSPPQTAVPV
jgi:hypothetical protein